ncbi:MAG: type II secretion system protein [Bacilli bacterium]|nr:type II secretion system protein [Bacilli bacterium]
MKKLNKKGFTLVELLAVIVILAVVMLIAVTAVGPLMTKARKSALGTEGVGMVNAAKTAYQTEQLSGKVGPTDSACFDLEWLCNSNYFEKGCTSGGDGYYGSVLATYSSGKLTYKFWLSNGSYTFGGVGTGLTNGIDPAKFDVEDTTNTVTDGTITAANKTKIKACGKTPSSNKISGWTYCSKAGNGCLK